MSLNKDIDDRIMKYLDGLMTAKEIADFEQDREDNAELDDMVSILENMNVIYDDSNWPMLGSDTEKLKEARLLFSNDDVQSFSKKVKSSETKFKNKAPKTIKKPLKFVSSIAAVLLLALCINYFFNSNTSANELFNEYYSTQDLPSFATKSSNINTLIEAETLFKEEKYTEALQLFDAITDDSGNPNILIYKAVSNLNLQQYDTALKHLDKLEKSNAIDFHKAYWFKALLHLKQDEKDKAIFNLKILTKNEGYFNHEKAIRLLNALN
ncbi:M48 family metallopeptidase [uncultured Psychroserpens sp.]|uniref:tetratricopeptide repeat protein n=1 Tax=uncultured Psychroserpens sp. TaxID=255436 RepID=UPI00261E18E4|nr:CDC27 family protein [uncultured Psychroserpens sp.]